MQQKHFFGNDCEIEKKNFGNDYEIQFDCVINHDTYNFLRVTLEVERGQNTEAMVLLNGIPIGKVHVLRNGKKTIGYTAYRLYKPANIEQYTKHHPDITFKQMGKAVAAIISDYVTP